MKNPIRFLVAAIAVAAATSGASAYAQDTATPPAKPKVYAIISAVGDQLTVVTQKKVVGSNIIDNFRREVIKVPGDAINNSVLKGLDKAIELKDPGSKRILARLNPLEMDGVIPVEREKVAMQKLLATLEKFPQRQEWDTIIVVTPKFQFSERKGMASKLEGIGIYVQPIGSSEIEDETGAVFDGGNGEETITPEGKPGKDSKTFIAPYNYTQTWVFDAKTLKVIDKAANFEYQKIYDPMSTAINVANSIPPDKLAGLFTRFV
ncbi:MAG: hypothetical protein JNN20_01680, partial [Betaproteobacteria bacterium]|nr:hypothetical protein [Betaproteobacteria bacterium]